MLAANDPVVVQTKGSHQRSGSGSPTVTLVGVYPINVNLLEGAARACPGGPGRASTLRLYQDARIPI